METLTFLGMGDLTGVDRAPEPTSSGATSPVLFGTISSIATIPGIIGTTSIAAATPGLFCAASSAASKLGRFSGATTGSVHAPVCVSSGTNSVVTTTYKSTGWQPDYDGVTSDSPAPRVFEGMPTPCHGMSSGIVSSLQWNQSNSYTGQDHQMLDTSSCFDYGTSAMTCSYCPTLQGRVLSVVMHQVKHPVPIGVLNHLFSLYGVVETIFQSLNQHGRKVLIQYKHGYMADNALRATHGWYLYRTYCQLDIRHADYIELQTLADYSCALFSEINDDADHLCHESTAMPQNEVSDCSQLVTLYMKGHTSEQEVQPNIPAFNVVTISTHEQKQPDGKHDASTVPNERVIEQPTLMQVLDELPSFHAPKVAVQLCSSEVVQAATMVGQGNPASSTPLVMHVDDPQLPTSAKDASDLFKEMPVFDVYEEDTTGSLNFVVELYDTGGQHKQYDREKPIYDHKEPHCATKVSSRESDNERLAVCFDTTSENAFSEETRDSVLKASNSVSTRSNQLSIEHCKRESRLLWDPGASTFLVTPLKNDSSTDSISDEHVGRLVSSTGNFSFQDKTDVWCQSEHQFGVIRRVFEEVMLDKPPAKPPDMYGIAASSPQVILLKIHKAENSFVHFNFWICNSKQLSAIQKAVLVLAVPCSKGNHVAKHAMSLSNGGCSMTNHCFPQLLMQSLCAATTLQVTKQRHHLEFILMSNIMQTLSEFRDGQLTYMPQSPKIKSSEFLRHMVTVLSCYLSSLQNGAKLQWEIAISSYMLNWLKMRAVKTLHWLKRPLLNDEECQSAMSNTPCVWDPGIESLLFPCNRLDITKLIQIKRWTSMTYSGISLSEYPYTMIFIHDQWDFIHQQGIQEIYNPKLLLSSQDYAKVQEMDVIFITFLPP